MHVICNLNFKKRFKCRKSIKKIKRNINRHFDFDQKFVTTIQFPIRKKKKFLKLTRKRRKEINSISNPNEILDPNFQLDYP